jgi:hypothetical protein
MASMQSCRYKRVWQIKPLLHKPDEPEPKRFKKLTEKFWPEILYIKVVPGIQKNILPVDGKILPIRD